jgi:hypothetical protein
MDGLVACCSTIPKVDRETGPRAALQSAAEAPVRDTLGYCRHTGTLTVYRHGFQQRPAVRPVTICPVSGLPIYGGHSPRGAGSKRGAIKGFSSRAALRLRTFLLTHKVEGSQVWDVTLTIPGEVTPDEWDALKRRMFKRWERAGFGVVWRVELQKRGTPHLHCVVWTPADMPVEKRNQLLYVSWWECLPEEKRFAAGAWKHAAHVKGPYTDIEQSPKWLAYVAAHASKRKKEQLGWQGKQWGRINEGLFEERQAMVEVSMTFEEEKKFKRLLSRYLNALSRGHRLKLMRRGIKPKRRLRRMFFPNGCKTTRIMDPNVITRMIGHVKTMTEGLNEPAGGEIRIADKASNLPKAFGQAAARAAATEPPPGARHV